MSARQRKRVLERDGRRCTNPDCLAPDSGPFEVDHVVGLFYFDLDPERWPLDRLTDDGNLRVLCCVCHRYHSNQQSALRAKLKRLALRVRKRT